MEYREPFSAGAALSNGFSAWFKNFVPFTVLSFLLHLPIIIWGIIEVQGTLDAAWLKRMQFFAIASAVGSLLVGSLLAASVSYGVVKHFEGTTASIGTSVSVGISRLLAVIVVAIVVAICILIGGFLCIVPGIIFMCMFYVAVPVAVIEKVGLGESLSRSRTLTAGNRLAIFGVVIVAGLINVGVDFVIKLIFEPKPALYLENPTAFMSKIRVLQYADLVVTPITGTLAAVLAATAYVLLRREKEGIDVNSYSNVFE